MPILKKIDVDMLKNIDHLRIPQKEVAMATNYFSDENLIGRGERASVYKGQLLLSGVPFTIATRRLDFSWYPREFWEEILILSSLKHDNIVSFLGFCDENGEKIIIEKYQANGSLNRHISDSNLRWTQRLRISVGIAQAFSYLNFDGRRDFSIVNSNLSSSQILLDENWVPKLSGFGNSRVVPSPKRSNNNPGYRTARTTIPNSDIYCLGIMLFEVLCGRTEKSTKDDDRFFNQLAKSHYEEGNLEDIIHPDLKKQMDPQSVRIFSEAAYYCLKGEQFESLNIDQIVRRLEKALEVHQNPGEFAHLRTPLQHIVFATSNFAVKNLIGPAGRNGKVYKGQLLPWPGEPTHILARKLDARFGKEVQFWTEISMLCSLSHNNVASIIGFCDENDEKIFIYKDAVDKTLDQHLGDPTLSWRQRLQICLGIARALSYIHFDVIHCDINSSKIFLDKDWEPKIFGFELSTKYPQSWRHQLLFSRYFDYNSMTPKSDVYSFGVLMFEVLCGRKIIIQDCVKEDLEEIIDPNLRKQMVIQSLNDFKIIARNCLNQQLAQRPTMDHIVQGLELVLELQMKHENLQRSTFDDEGTSSNSLKMDLLKIPLSEIRLATNDFGTTHLVGSGGFGTVYKAKLDVFDVHRFSSMEEKSKYEVPKINKVVAVKRIIKRSNEQGKQGFLTEIELLSRCKHPNIVSLLGFSKEDSEMILVYEYILNGCLSHYLGSKRQSNLTWVQRLQICLDIAYGLSYLHSNMEGKPMIIHRDIKSENILLDENFKAKVADFGLSKFHLTYQQASTVQTRMLAGTEYYMDPEFLSTGKYKKETDIYSFGVVMFEVLSGKLAYDSIFTEENEKGIAPIARRRFNEGTLKELIDPTIREEDDELTFTLNRGPNQDSFASFSRIAYQCLAETQAKRPTMEVIIKELQNALKLQGESVVLSRFRINDIKLATENFSETYFIGLDRYGVMYKAQLNHFDRNSLLMREGKNHGEPSKRCINVAVKRFTSRDDDHRQQVFFEEIEMLCSHKHPNIVSLLGFCDDDNEMIMIYEHACNGSLEDYLRSNDEMITLTWTKRLHKCLEIACGLNHLHNNMNDKQRVIHGDIRSANILLGKNWEAKIAYFGSSRLQQTNQEAYMLTTRNDVATKVYWDPEHEKVGKLKKESDIYSLGVILFEIFCGKLAYDPSYMENDRGLAAIVSQCFIDETINEIIDPRLLRTTEEIHTSHEGPNQDSLKTFLKIAHQCLEENQDQRPTMGIIIKELEMALNLQENLMSSLKMSLEDIKSATEDFSQKHCVESGRYWKAYKREVALPQANINANVNGRSLVVAKRFDSKSHQGNIQFSTELEILFRYKHENIISLAGYCDEMDEKIIIFKDESKGGLDKYLNKPSLTWIQRLKICIDVARGLEFLHSGAVTLRKVVHRDMKSSSIVLNDDWKAKISNLELSSLDSSHQDMEHFSNNANGAFGYLDPEYTKLGFLSDKSDIYSFGMILFEILCGRLAWAHGYEDHSRYLRSLAKEGTLQEIVFEGLKEQIDQESLTTFSDIAYQCIEYHGNDRPTTSEVLKQLKKALEFQEDKEIWGPKLPINYKQILEKSETPRIYSTHNKKNLYEKLSQGIFLQEGREWFSLSRSGMGNTMISATKFSYKNYRSFRWRSTKKSRFHTVAKLMDISNLNIQIKIKTEVLSSDVVYGVHLVFKFCDSRKFSNKLMYVDLKYKMGSETLHAYFAKLRDDDGWMMIELCRFLNQKDKNTDFEVSLESLSRYYCGSGAIYVQGIEFIAVENEKLKESMKLVEVQLVPAFTREKFLLNEVNGKKHLMLSAEEVLYNTPKLECFQSQLSAKSRFQVVMKLLPGQVFRIKYKIKSEMLTSFTEYACYLVFKLSKTRHGLHCPVKVRDLLHRKDKETKIIYFRSPTPWNQHDANWIPHQRTDGWMEVMVWKLNTKSKSGKNHIPINLKLITYEGTMSGLIICGFVFRPVYVY